MNLSQTVIQFVTLLVIIVGVFEIDNKNLSVGAEVSGRTSMINTAAEQNSFDFALRLNTSL